MPIYEYKCDKCESVFECIKSFSDLNGSSETCPNCSYQAKRIISICNFHLKGSGWYKTDYQKARHTDGKEKLD